MVAERSCPTGLRWEWQRWAGHHGFPEWFGVVAKNVGRELPSHPTGSRQSTEATLIGMHEADEVGEYRPVSGLAVAAAAIGCLSALTIFSPLFWFIPLFGLIVSVAALRILSQPGHVKVGRFAALAGLALSIGFGCQAAATRFTAGRIMSARATLAASAWLEAVREDRLLDARGMMSPSILPAPEYLGGHSDAPAVGDPVAQEPAIEALDYVRAIRECPRATADIRCTGHVPDSRDSRETWMTQITLSTCDDGSRRQVVLALQPTLRAMAGGSVERWEVTKVDPVGPAPTGR